MINIDFLPNNPYLLLTPGPLSTTKSVRAAMLQDWCTWDDDYKEIVQDIRLRLLKIAGLSPSEYTTVLMQGSGTFCVESVIGSTVPENGTVLIIENGAYGNRISRMAEIMGINYLCCKNNELERPDINTIEKMLYEHPEITHVTMVHVETTTGIENPLKEIAEICNIYQKTFIVDAMSSFGGIPIDIEELGIDFLISSANKCIQGVPGMGFVIAKKEELELIQYRARSLSLDLYDQWQVMENQAGKWRYTSPTHVVRAFHQALLELESEGGIEARYARYRENHSTLIHGMREAGFYPVISEKIQAPIITTFYSPANHNYSFEGFYQSLKRKGFVIYPGKVTSIDTFRIGNIGNVFPEDMRALIRAVKNSIHWEEKKIRPDEQKKLLLLAR